MSLSDVDTEEPNADSSSGQQTSAPEPKARRRSFRSIRRDLTDDELGSPGVQKMMLDEIDRLEQVEARYDSIQVEHSDLRVSNAILSEKLRTHKALDTLSIGTIAIGSSLFGLTISIDKFSNVSYSTIGLSIVLIFIGVIAKVMRA